MRIKRLAIVILCVVLLFVSGVVPRAFANWYDYISGGRYVEIKGKNCAVDYFCGVPALYNEGGTIYNNELVIRFYRKAYGLEISADTSGIAMKTEGYKFITPTTPKPGDVVYVSAAQRGTYDHWAIVKSYDGTNITLFEQNVKNGGHAIVDRQLKYPSNSYYLYTPVSTGNNPDPVLKNVDESTTRPTTTKVPTTTIQSITTTTATLTSTKTDLSKEETFVRILNPSRTIINYGDSIVLRAEIQTGPYENTKILWSANNNNFKIVEISEDGRLCVVTPISSGDTVFVVTLVDETGKSIVSDTQDMISEAGFFQRILAFFRRVLGLTLIFVESV